MVIQAQIHTLQLNVMQDTEPHRKPACIWIKEREERREEERERTWVKETRKVGEMR